MRYCYFSLFFLLIVLTSCFKDEFTKAECEDCNTSLTDLTFSSAFDWKTTRNISLNVVSGHSAIIEIASGDGSEIIHKGYFDGTSESYYVEIVVPSNLETIIVNGQLVILNGNSLEVILDSIAPALKNGNQIDGLVSYWSLNENSGAQITDANGINPGTLISGTRVQGIAGNALEFDGATGLARVPESSSLDITQQLTLTAWANTYEKKESKIAQKGDWDGFNLGLGKWDGWKASIYMADNTSHTLHWLQGIPLFNEWYFLAMTFNGSEFKFYVNGQLKNTAPISGLLKNNNRNFCIGSDNGAQKFFHGMIDEVAVYNSALSAEEIQTLYQTFPNTDSDGDGVPDLQDEFDNDPARAFLVFFPPGGNGSLAFEDLWPALGDFDFNDLVLDFRFRTILNASNHVAELFADFTLRAVGASHRNGFGFQFTGNFPESDIGVSGCIYTEGIIENLTNGTESGQDKTTVIVFDNTYRILQSEGGSGINVIPGNPYVEPVTVSVTIDFTDNLYTLSEIDIGNFNPFLIIDRERGREVHLPDYPPTSLSDESYFGTSQDDSDPGSGKFYKTTQNIPWVILLPDIFDYPAEKCVITDAYLHFTDWALSSGTNHTDWYLNFAGYRDSTVVYQP